MNKNTTMGNIRNAIRIRSTRISTLTSTKMNTNTNTVMNTITNTIVILSYP